MNDEERDSSQSSPRESEFGAFQKLARALFGVKREDVPKHEPKKREKKSQTSR